MVATITFNPNITTTAAGSFQRESTGLIQGQAMDDPSARFRLRGGPLASAETLPMWGGIAVSEGIPGAASQPNPSLGPSITRATSVAVPSGKQAVGAITGISVFDQNHAMISTPQSPVPSAGTGMLVNYYPLGSLARIAVAIDPALVSYNGFLTRSQFSWDFGGQRLVQFQTAFTGTTITNAVWSAGNVTFTTGAAHGVAVGSAFNVTGVVPAGYNGSYIALAGTAGSTLVGALAANPGAFVSAGALPGGGGAFPCAVLETQIGNSMTVAYDSTTGFLTWNRSGSCAIIQI